MAAVEFENTADFIDVTNHNGFIFASLAENSSKAFVVKVGNYSQSILAGSSTITASRVVVKVVPDIATTVSPSSIDMFLPQRVTANVKPAYFDKEGQVADLAAWLEFSDDSFAPARSLFWNILGSADLKVVSTDTNTIEVDSAYAIRVPTAFTAAEGDHLLDVTYVPMRDMCSNNPGVNGSVYIKATVAQASQLKITSSHGPNPKIATNDLVNKNAGFVTVTQ